MFMDWWSWLGDGQWKMALVAACGEEGGGVGQPWQLRAVVDLAHALGSG
jgi:hypothetical protein